jgi:glutathione synthase/RimK-type ligase-like ATP-grasp enzyme
MHPAPRLVLLSCDDLTGFVHDDNLLVEELTRAGYRVETRSWSANLDWTQFDVAILRTTWDYTKRIDEFLEKLGQIRSSGVRVLNSVEVVRWNYHKRYTLELEEKGVAIVPTCLFVGKPSLPDSWQAERYVIKPAISAGGFEAKVRTRSQAETLNLAPDPREWMIQPFLDSITEGEVSLFYFNGKFSHAAKKTPKPGEFRVQEEHGGLITGFDPPKKLQDLGSSILKHVPFELLYARVDLVPNGGTYLLMELELIEPSLYFRTHPQAARNFRQALDAFLS